MLSFAGLGESGLLLADHAFQAGDFDSLSIFGFRHDPKGHRWKECIINLPRPPPDAMTSLIQA